MEVRVESPFPFEALPRIWRWIEPFRSKVSDDFSPHTLGEFVDAMARKWDAQRTWSVYGDGELGGLITFERITPRVGTAHIICKPELQGKGLAVKALRLAFAEMFAEVEKLAFFPLAGNLAIGSLIINLGGHREGCLKAHTLSGGKPTDVWVYGLLKSEFEEKCDAVFSRHTVIDGDSGERGDRGRCIDSGLGDLGQTEDEHQLVNQHDHANAHA